MSLSTEIPELYERELSEEESRRIAEIQNKLLYSSVQGLNSRRKLRTQVMPPLVIRPVYGTNLYSPLPIYKNVKVTLNSGAYWKYDEIQDDPGIDAGIAVTESDLSARLADTDLQAPFEYDYTHKTGSGLISICTVYIESLKLELPTVVIGIPNLDSPVVGRFMIGDCLNKLFKGHLADSLALPLTNTGLLSPTGSAVNVDPGTYSLTPTPTAETVLLRHRSSEIGKRLYEAVETELKRAIELYKMKAYKDALPGFQRCSVWGYFTHNKEDYAGILVNLAIVYFVLKEKEKALHFGKESQKLTPSAAAENLINKLKDVQM